MHPAVQTFLRRTVFATVYYNLRLWQRLTVDGLEHLPRDGPALLISNHPSYLDPPAIYVTTSAIRRVHFMAWDELFGWPVVGWVCSSFDAFPVNLDKADRDSYRQASKLLAQGKVIGIFPEGQRSDRDGFHPIKRGGVRLAMRHRAPIVPCVIFGTRYCWPLQRNRPRAGKVHVRLLPKIEPPQPASNPSERVALERELMQQLHRLINDQLIERGEIETMPHHAWEVISDNGQQA